MANETTAEQAPQETQPVSNSTTSADGANHNGAGSTRTTKSKRVAKQKAIKKTTVTKQPKEPKAIKTKETKPKTQHPSFIKMISDALNKLADKNGSSRQAIVKFIVNTYKLEEKFVNQHVKFVLKNGVKSGSIKQSKGVGATGSFKLVNKLKKEKKNTNVDDKDVKPKEAKTNTTKSTNEKKAPKLVKVTITKTKNTSKTPKTETKPKKNVQKVVKVVAKKPVTKPVTKEAAKSRMKSVSSKKTKPQSVQVQIKVKKAERTKVTKQQAPVRRTTNRKA